MLYALSNKMILPTGSTIMFALLVYIAFYNTLYLKFRDPHRIAFVLSVVYCKWVIALTSWNMCHEIKEFEN